MLGNFTYHNPTKLYFGKDALDSLAEAVNGFGPNVMLSYGGGSIRRSGLYDRVLSVLHACGKTVIEDGGVMPNPTYDRVLLGAKRARENGIDLILAVGGGSVCDYAKAVSVSAYCSEDPWEKFFVRGEEPSERILPVGCVLTMTGTGSEMNGGSVITNRERMIKKGHVFGSEVMPRFSILDPTLTYTLPEWQMVAGIYDAFNHICEQYFSGEDENVTDYLCEGLMRALISASYRAKKDPHDYEARSDIMWAATWALNTLLDKGKTTDWEVHMLGQAVGAYTDATHGMTLSAVSLPYYRHILKYGLKKFRRFAISVWGVSEEGSDEEIAKKGLAALENWMKDMGLVLNISDLGVTPDMIEDIADATFIQEGGYHVLTRDEIVEILKESL